MNRAELIEEAHRLEQEILEKKKQLTELRKEIPEQVSENYQFEIANGKKTSLLDLFQDKNELIMIHNMGKGCAYCTMWADGFNGVYHHLIDHCAFVVASPDSPEVQEDFSAERGWTFPMVSTRGTTLTTDFGFMIDHQIYPGVITFRKDREDNIFQHAKTYFGPGDDFCSVWPLFDLLPSGSENYRPKRKINPKSAYQLTNNIAVQVKDFDKAVQFYENIIGMKKEQAPENETKLSLNGTNFFVEENDEGNVFFEFAVDDFEGTQSQLLDAGCQVTKQYSDKSAMFRDPFGLRFHLFEVRK